MLGMRERINLMYKNYGRRMDRRCETCCNLHQKKRATALEEEGKHICIAYGDNGEQDCLWDCHTMACGLYNQAFLGLRPAHRPLIDLCGGRKTSREDDSQISIPGLF